jgi:hypothetical protein
MTTSVYFWPSPNFLVPFPKKSDPPLPAAGAAATVTDYLTNEVLAGTLLLYNPEPAPSTAVPITGTAANTNGLVLSVRYANGLAETAFQLNVFTPLYSASTINMGTGAYSLLREGGLPPTVSVVASAWPPGRRDA